MRLRGDWGWAAGALLMAGVCVGCGEDDGSAAAVTGDGGSTDAASQDAASALDGGASEDAASETDAGDAASEDDSSTAQDATTGDEDAASTCGNGGGEAPVGPCLIAAHAGTYAVSASQGGHTRGTVTLGPDGAIDYDDGLHFLPSDWEGVYDRLECCMRISAEATQRPDNDTGLAADARHRVDVFTDGTTPGSAVVRFEYYPNWPDEGAKVVLDVTP